MNAVVNNRNVGFKTIILWFKITGIVLFEPKFDIVEKYIVILQY